MQDLAQINDEDITDAVNDLKTGDLYKIPATGKPHDGSYETAVDKAGERMKTGEMLEITEEDIIDPEHDSAMKTLDNINAELDKSQAEKDMINDTLSRLDEFNKEVDKADDGKTADDSIDVKLDDTLENTDDSIDVDFDDATKKEDKRLVKFEQEAIRLEHELEAKRVELAKANMIKKFMIKMSINGLEGRISDLRSKINRRKEIIEINRSDKKAA